MLGKTLDFPLSSSDRGYSSLVASDRTCWVSCGRSLKDLMSLSFATLIAYIGILSILAIASPGHGLFGSILLILPTYVLDWLHAPAYGLLAWLGIIGLQRRGWPRLLAIAAGASFAFIFGVWTETLQLSVPGRGLEIKDMLTDGLGIAMASLMVLRQSISVRTAPAADPENSHSVTTLEDAA